MNATLQNFLNAQLDTLKAEHLYKPLVTVHGTPGARVTVDGREMINLSSNNYLGLAGDMRLRKAASDAALEIGAGGGAVRPIIGNLELHDRLEKTIADFKHVDSVMVFQSGFTANAGTIPTILDKDDAILTDALNHASIIDGCRLASVPKERRKIYAHCDMESLETALKETQDAKKRLIITDGVFSMDGDLGPLPALCDLADEFGCIMMVDDAHASGVFGRQGRGTVDHFGCHGRVDIQVGTLSKAIGVLGGYVAGTKSLIEFLHHRARPFLFSTSHPPAVTAACIAALDVLETEPQWMERLWDNTRFFKAGLTSLGFNTGISESPITPVIVGEAPLAATMSDKLFAKGVFAQSIGFPTVARGQARLRTIVSATHTREDLQFALDTMGDVGRELGVI